MDTVCASRATLVLLLPVAISGGLYRAYISRPCTACCIKPVSFAGFYRLLLRYRRLKNTLALLSLWMFDSENFVCPGIHGFIIR